MVRTVLLTAALAAAAGCGVNHDGEPRLGAVRSAGVDAQGVDAQGIDMSGNTFDARKMYLHSQKYDKATWNGIPVCLRLVEGQLLAELSDNCDGQKDGQKDGQIGSGGKVISGEDLVGLEVYTDEFLPDGTLGKTDFIYRVVKVSPEYAPLPPSFPAPYSVGTTFLYQLEFENVKGDWVSPCKLDADGFSGAIATHGTWSSQGDKLPSSKYFTFGCTSGVVAKCYRWGYMPWKGADFWNQHWACTRLARADYCGDGYSWTNTGTSVNHWDYQAPASVQEWEPDPTYNEANGFFFEAGWDTTGARCVSHFRWNNLPEGFPEDACTDQIRGPNYKPEQGCGDKDDPRDCEPTICNDEKEALATWPETLQLNKSQCNGSGTCSAP